MALQMANRYRWQIVGSLSMICILVMICSLAGLVTYSRQDLWRFFATSVSNVSVTRDSVNKSELGERLRERDRERETAVDWPPVALHAGFESSSEQLWARLLVDFTTLPKGTYQVFAKNRWMTASPAWDSSASMNATWYIPCPTLDPQLYVEVRQMMEVSATIPKSLWIKATDCAAPAGQCDPRAPTFTRRRKRSQVIRYVYFRHPTYWKAQSRWKITVVSSRTIQCSVFPNLRRTFAPMEGLWVRKGLKLPEWNWSCLRLDSKLQRISFSCSNYTPAKSIRWVPLVAPLDFVACFEDPVGCRRQLFLPWANRQMGRRPLRVQFLGDSVLFQFAAAMVFCLLQAYPKMLDPVALFSKWVANYMNGPNKAVVEGILDMSFSGFVVLSVDRFQHLKPEVLLKRWGCMQHSEALPIDVVVFNFGLWDVQDRPVAEFARYFPTFLRMLKSGLPRARVIGVGSLARVGLAGEYTGWRTPYSLLQLNRLAAEHLFEHGYEYVDAHRMYNAVLDTLPDGRHPTMDLALDMGNLLLHRLFAPELKF